MSRIQLALEVDDIEAATTFHARLFGVEPAKTRPGYANAAITDPPLTPVLLENPGQGFAPVDRDELPRPLAGSAELQGACPASAHALLRPAPVPARPRTGGR